MKKIYYQLTMKQNSPLRIGAMNSSNSDSDILLDGRGVPFIPGSSLAGILRSMLSEEDGVKLFGDVDGDKSCASKVIISDAVITGVVESEKIHISVRDGVGLNDKGTNVSGSKYDFEVVETEYSYVAIVEWNGDDSETDSLLKSIIQELVQNGICVGAKTTRGFGNLSVVAKKLEFTFPSDLDRWLLFDAFASKAFDAGENVEKDALASSDMCIKIKFCMNGNFTVRVNTSDYVELADGTTPDSMPLFGMNKKPVIPGTSWAGSFRHHMRNILNEISDVDNEESKHKIDELFGKMQDEGSHKKSVLTFSESSITGGKGVVVTRNALDRFTQAPANEALFTNMVWYGGNGELTITVKNNVMDSLYRQLLAITIIDMNIGLMSLGGESSIGRGLVNLTDITVNGVNKMADVLACKADFLEV